MSFRRLGERARIVDVAEDVVVDAGNARIPAVAFELAADVKMDAPERRLLALLRGVVAAHGERQRHDEHAEPEEEDARAASGRIAPEHERRARHRNQEDGVRSQRHQRRQRDAGPQRPDRKPASAAAGPRP